MTIREYLCREAEKITARALSEYTDAETWRKLVGKKREQFMEMMGLEELPPPGERPPLNSVTVDVLQRDGYRIEKLYYESLPKLYVAANLYIPDGLEGPAPAVLYVCGHSQTQKVRYQPHPRRWAQLGFVSLILESIDLGEVRGEHHGTYRQGWFHWYSRGYTPAGVELLNGIRGLDLLCQRAEVDAERLGVTGISGGGASTWWIAAADERIKMAAPVCGTATLASQIADRTIDGHCDCMWWINMYLWDLADVGGLIAPRPLMIASADHDSIFKLESVRRLYGQLRRLYEMLGAGENIQLVETPGPHSYHPISRKAIFAWFIKHLQGKEVSPEEVEDLEDVEVESENTLRVFVNGPLPDDRSYTIQDELVPLAPLPVLTSAEDVEEHRQRVLEQLRAKCFQAFPEQPPELDVEITLPLGSHGMVGYRFAYTSEEGYRLVGRLTISTSIETPAPAVVVLRQRGEARNASEGFAVRVPVRGSKIVIEPRGTGDTAWGEELDWHVRRAAAWTGRTVASMRVWDVLRGLQAVRTLEEVAGDKIVLAGSGEMAAVALYAALLDGGVAAVVLHEPPPTQNAPSRPDGKGPAIEILSCLRFVDVNHIAGLLWPREVVIVGDCPDSYRWAENLYQRLGTGERFVIVSDVSQWELKLDWAGS